MNVSLGASLGTCWTQSLTARYFSRTSRRPITNGPTVWNWPSGMAGQSKTVIETDLYAERCYILKQLLGLSHQRLDEVLDEIIRAVSLSPEHFPRVDPNRA